MTDDMQNGTGPLSWRDVYRAVSESEERIVKAIQDAVEPLGRSAEDHESRLRVLESTGSAKTNENSSRIALLAEQHANIKETFIIERAVAQARVKLLSTVVAVLTLVNIGLGVVLAFSSIFHVIP